MSAINSLGNHCLVIYTNIEDEAFNDELLYEHTTLLEKAYKVDTVRLGSLISAYSKAIDLSKSFDVIEIATHGNSKSIDLGSEKVEVNGRLRITLQKLINLLNEHGILLLHCCLAGAETSDGLCFGEYAASLSEKPIRVIAKKVN